MTDNKFLGEIKDDFIKTMKKHSRQYLIDLKYLIENDIIDDDFEYDFPSYVNSYKTTYKKLTHPDYYSVIEEYLDAHLILFKKVKKIKKITLFNAWIQATFDSRLSFYLDKFVK